MSAFGVLLTLPTAAYPRRPLKRSSTHADGCKVDAGQGVDLEQACRQEHRHVSSSPEDRGLSDQRQEFWTSSVRFGFLLLAGESIAVLLCLRLESNGFHRPALMAISSLDTAIALGAVFLASRIASLAWRSECVLGAALYAGVALAVCIHLDGGLGSPLIFLMMLPIASVALLLPPWAVVACGIATLMELCLVAVTDPFLWRSEDGLWMLTASLVGLTIVGTGWAISRSRLQAGTDRLVDELAYRAETDALTGCLNHGAFFERLESEIDRTLRHQEPLSLLVADVDLFKAYNDAHGHAAGDTAISVVGSVLRTTSRSFDVVSRVGGDEFAVILPETSSSEAAQIADRMAKALERPDGMTITTSIGFATLDLAEPTSKRLFTDADSGLYRAKANGRSCVASRFDTQAGSPGDATGMVVDRAERRRRDRRLRTAVHLTSEALAMLDVLQSTSSVGLGFIDRDFRVIRINPMLAGIIGKSPEKVVGQAMDEVAPALWPRLEPSFRAVMDTGQPMCNEEIAGETAEDPGHLHFWLANHYPVMLEGHVEGIGIVVVDICDRKRLEESRALLTRAVVAALSSTVEMSDPYTAGHQKAVADIAVAIATELHVSADDIETIDLAARIHDLGKVAVPAELLSRPGRLRDAEMDLVRTHAQAGSDILEHVDFPAGVREIVLQHHERLDGSGYPQGLRGEQISIGARIVAVADVLEAMAAYRPYRPALGIEIARKELQKGSDSLYDAAVVDACVRLIEDGRIRETQSGQNLETLQIPARSDCRPQAPVGLAGIEQRADPVVPK